MVFRVALPTLLLASCSKPAGSDPEPCTPVVWYADADGDRYGDPDAAVEACDAPGGYVGVAGDCDDGDVEVSPQGVERCDDRDEDCDGEVDDAASDVATWYADRDGDGWGDADDALTACFPASPWTLVRTGDCDDGDAGRNPDAQEVCNGLDDDCDARVDSEDGAGDLSYADLDADGYGDEATAVVACGAPPGNVAEAGDCDDGAADVFPGAEDPCGDHVDQDCAGDADTCSWRGKLPIGTVASAVVYGKVERGQLASDFAALGDVDGDGDDDFALTGAAGTQEGVVWLVGGGATGSVAVADQALAVFDADETLSGSVASAGDLDGDGVAELVIGAPEAGTYRHGEVYLVSADATGTVDPVSEGKGRLVGENQAGLAVVSGRDVYGDGVADVVVGTSYYGAWVVDGADMLGSSTLDDAASATIAPEDARDTVGESFALVDHDGDGLAEVIVGAPDHGDGGAFYVVPAPSGVVDLASEAKVTSPTRSDDFGEALGTPGDVDGDGYEDLLAGGRAGAPAYVFSGPLASGTVADARTVFAPTVGGGDVSLSGADLDGDGFLDVAIGVGSGSTADPGDVFVFYGPVPAGTLVRESDAAADFYGVAFDDLGAALEIADFDGDALPDLLVGVPFDGTAAYWAGAAYPVSFAVP